MDIWDRQYRVRIGKNNSVGREIGKPNEKTKRAIRCSFSCEIGDGHIQIDDYVKVESREDKGNYRASKIRFIGDTEGDDWQCVGQFVEVK